MRSSSVSPMRPRCEPDVAQRLGDAVVQVPADAHLVALDEVVAPVGLVHDEDRRPVDRQDDRGHAEALEEPVVSGKTLPGS